MGRCTEFPGVSCAKIDSALAAVELVALGLEALQDLVLILRLARRTLLVVERRKCSEPAARMELEIEGVRVSQPISVLGREIGENRSR